MGLEKPSRLRTFYPLAPGRKPHPDAALYIPAHDLLLEDPSVEALVRAGASANQAADFHARQCVELRRMLCQVLENSSRPLVIRSFDDCKVIP